MTFMKQSAFYLTARLVPALIGLGGVAIYTRLLDPSAMGQFALLAATSYLVSAICYTWLRISALRILATCNTDEFPNFAATVFLLYVAVSSVVVPLTMIALHVYQPKIASSSVALAAIAVAATAWSELNAALMQARLNVHSWSLLNLMRAISGVTVSTILLLLGWKINALLAGFVVGNSTALTFLKMWLPAKHGCFDKHTARRCFDFGWPQSISVAQASVAPVGQRWIINSGAGAAALGVFTVAQDFGNAVLSSLIGSVSLAGIPLAFQAKDRGDYEGLRAQLRVNAQLIFAIALPATVGICLLAGPVSHIIFGSGFWKGTPQILSIVAVAAFATNLRMYYFDQAFELVMKTRAQASISMAGTAFAICGCVVFVPRYGSIGAAIATLLASIACLALSVWLGASVLPMPIPTRDWLKTALATGAMGFVLSVGPKMPSLTTLVFEIAGGCAVYIAASAIARPKQIRNHLFPRFAASQ